MLPHMVPALWHCQVPTSVIDVTPAQIEVAADEGIEEDGASSATEAMSLSDNEPVLNQHVGDASREVSSHPPDDGRVSRNASDPESGDDQEDHSDIDDLCTRMGALKAAEDVLSDADELCIRMTTLKVDEDESMMSPGQASGDTVMTELSTQSYLTDIEDRPVSDYPTESDSSRPSVVKDLISLWDGLVVRQPDDEGRWTSGELHYHDGSLAEGRIDTSRLTYDKDGLDKYGRPRAEHWSKSFSPVSTEKRKVISTSGFMTEEDRDVRQSIRDQDIAMVSTAETDTSGRRTPTEAKTVGGRRMRMARGMTVDSGAADNVIPRRMIRGKFNKIRPSKGSRAGVHYVSASSARIRNEGECDFHFTTKDGHKENYTFQIAEVNKALCAVSYLVDQHNQVIFDKDDVTGLDISRIINKKTGKIIQMTRERNVWTIDAFIEEEPNQDDDFGRLG